MKIQLKSLLIYIPVIIVSFVILFPIIYLFSASIQPQIDITHIPPYIIPAHPTLEHYANIVSRGGILTKSFMNSLIVVCSTTAITILMGSLSGYAFSRLNFRMKNSLFLFLLLTQMIPSVALIIPLYLVYRTLGIYDTYIGLILLYCATVLPYVTWLMRGYFDSLSPAYEESAMIDGCSNLGAIFRITLPLSTPGLAACAMYTFIEAWNEFYLAYILTSTDAITIQATLGSYLGKQTAEFGTMFAAAIIGSLPMLLFVVIFRKYIVKGLVSGGLKF